MYSFKLEREREERKQVKKKLLQWTQTKEAQNISNRITWIIYDIVNHDHISCLDDIRRNRQSHEEVLKAIGYILSLEFIKPIREEIQTFEGYIIS